MRKYTILMMALFAFQIAYPFVCANVIAFAPTKKRVNSLTYAHGGHKFSAALCLDALCLIQPKSEDKCIK
jgi:hypothetical protein